MDLIDPIWNCEFDCFVYIFWIHWFELQFSSAIQLNRLNEYSLLFYGFGEYLNTLKHAKHWKYLWCSFIFKGHQHRFDDWSWRREGARSTLEKQQKRTRVFWWIGSRKIWPNLWINRKQIICRRLAEWHSQVTRGAGPGASQTSILLNHFYSFCN